MTINKSINLAKYLKLNSNVKNYHNSFLDKVNLVDEV